MGTPHNINCHSLLHISCERLEPTGLPRSQLLSIAPSQFVIAGWTGRDEAAIRHHIHELAQLGVPSPSSTPLYYRASASLLTQAAKVEVLGDESSGEAEPVLFFAAGEWWLTVGSDHTDRKVETYSVAVSKQMCPKPLATMAWRWADVEGYQDELLLRSRIFEGGRWVSYQQGVLSAIRPLMDLCAGSALKVAAKEGCFLSCGTLGALPNDEGTGIRPACEMEIEMVDPRQQRRIVHRYAVHTLPVVA